MEKPSIPKGTRDFGPAAMGKRQFIFNTIRSVYQKYGFQPLETPSMENLSVLTGKYGDEGDQLLFRVLDSGDFFSESSELVAKASHYLIQSLKHVAYELFDPKIQRYTSVNYPSKDEITKPGVLFNWLKEYYATNILRGRMVESLDYSFDFIISSRDQYPRLLNDISEFLSEIFSNQMVNRHFTSREEIDHILNFEIIRSYNKLYSIIGRVTNQRAIRANVAEKGLRYDLTVPFARYVVMNRGEITFPFKRYQIQPVWRADRPQKGRYREFYQCDADVVGTTSLLCEAEIVMMIREVMKGLGVTDFTIKINHRGVLKGIADTIEATGKETALYVAIDKLDKIGKEGVSKELSEAGFAPDKIELLFNILSTTGSNEQKRLALASLFKSESGQKGLNDLKTVFDLLEASGSDQNNLEFDISLARGLSYYTGCIFEVKINNVSIGSVSGGGRYDNLTASFGDKENLSGVGISFGVDRLYDVLEELQLFPKEIQRSSKVLICFLDTESMRYGLKVLASLRAASIASELYPDESKLKKQLDYANKKMIPYTIVIGEEERKEGKLMLKNMDAGTQEKVTLEEIIQTLKT